MKNSTHGLLIALVLCTFILSCHKTNDLITQPGEFVTTANGPKNHNSFLYTESNAAGTNSILAYQLNQNGTLEYLSTTASGGNGSGSSLGSQGALALSDDRKWLFAVNAGSNSISSFAIDENGGLTLASTVSSNGILPVSITVRNNLLYVANSNSDNISGFTIGSNGSLNLISGSTQTLSAENATPAQISFSPPSSYSFNNYLLVTEKTTNKITRFNLTGSVAGPGSSITSCNTTPFGIAFADNYAIISQSARGVANASTLSLYMSGTNLISGPIHANQTTASWAKITSDGKYIYVSNTGCNTLTLFAVDRYGMITVIDNVAATTGIGPADLTLSSNESFLYVINSGSHSISAFRRGSNTSLRNIGEVTGLPTFAAGLVAY